MGGNNPTPDSSGSPWAILHGTTLCSRRYIRKRLEGVFTPPFSLPSICEVVFSDAFQKANDVNTMDIAKRPIDFSFQPYMTAFPVVGPGAPMIESSKWESKAGYDLFIDAMRAIAAEAAPEPDLVAHSPYTMRIGRLDEVAAARKPVLRWKSKSGGD